MAEKNLDSFKSQKSLQVNGKTYHYFSLPEFAKNLAKSGGRDFSKLPFSLKILLENLLRHEDGVTVKLSFSTPYHQSIAKSQHNRDYEKPVMQAWMREIGGKKIIYDVGGFNGLYGLLAAVKNSSAQVTIFEPDRVNAAHIRANILLNELKNCTIQEAAVSDFTGTTTFSQGGTSGEHIGSTGDTVKVIALRDLPHADLLKIDVEGAELKALTGMEYMSTILLEVHPLFVGRFDTTEADIADFLNNRIVAVGAEDGRAVWTGDTIRSLSKSAMYTTFRSPSFPTHKPLGLWS